MYILYFINIIRYKNWGNILHIITLDDLSSAIEKRLDISKEEAKDYANMIMDLFGFDDRIIDNVLEHEERQLFYMLESEGMLDTGRDEITLYDGRIWRVHYWILNKNIILQYSHSKKWAKNEHMNKKIPKLQKDNIYSSLPGYVWAARKS
ncbi:MAG: DUF6015 family protein [Petrotogales bacterium]